MPNAAHVIAQCGQPEKGSTLTAPPSMRPAFT